MKTIRQILTAVLMLALIGQVFSKVVVIVDFYANQSWIAGTLCENKAKPQLKCGGKCQLSKKLDKQSKQEEKTPEQKSENKAEVWNCQSSFAQVPTLFCLNKKAFPLLPSPETLERTSAIFQPPQLTV